MEQKIKAPEIKVPFGLNTNNALVSIRDAQKGSGYRCPNCLSSLVLRQGNRRVWHFAHAQTLQCNQETVIHKTAKLLIQQAVRDWKQGIASVPILTRACISCNKNTDQPLPDKVDDAVLEFREPGGFILDVALLVLGDLAAGVEVHVTHLVDEEKAQQLSVPFIEVEGEQILEDALHWQPIQDTFKPIICAICKTDYQRFMEKINTVSRATGVAWSGQPYRCMVTGCWKCGKEILVFTWPNHGEEPSDWFTNNPPPKTVQNSYSKTVGGKYMANNCPYCHALQGDFFLYNEPDGAFWGFHTGEDSQEGFLRDVHKLGHLYFRYHHPNKNP